MSMPDQGIFDRVSPPKVSRKKFSKPPVKVACLACRASRVRCDGKETCSGCASKGKECSYLPSKRGGPRKKKVIQSSVIPANTYDKHSTSNNSNSRFDEVTFNQLDSLAVPGAGIRQLDFSAEVQSMFEGLLVPASGNSSRPSLPAENVPLQVPAVNPPKVRLYGNERDILNGYYIFIHNYFPVFPPPPCAPAVDCPLNVVCKDPDEPLPYQPASPVSLAISAILALIPPPKDPNPTSAESVFLRRSFAQRFAQAAFESVEAEAEMAESSSNPTEALQRERTFPNRLPIHPHTPTDLEAILALLILSVYEYAQRGNLVKMRYRAGQAYTIAMNMSLHALGPEECIFSEAKRRAWWMTYYSVCQGSIVSTTRATIMPDDPRFVTPHPNFASDSKAWSILLRAQHVLITATQHIIELNQTLKARGSMAYINERMKTLDPWIEYAMAEASKLPSPSPSAKSAHDPEAITARSIRAISQIKLCSARIKTHRFRAFLDIPIFIKKHCDLTCASIGYPDIQKPVVHSHTDSPSKLSCSCGSLSQVPIVSNIKDSPSSCCSTPEAVATSPSAWIDEGEFSFSNQESTSICLKAALTAGRMFHSLPYPNPVYPDLHENSRPRTPSDQASMPPRTMPSFACCAMQSSYAMLMLYYKSRVSEFSENAGDSYLGDPELLTRELYQGLHRVISAVKNYSRAFEALDGMRDEIEGAFQTAFPQP